MILIRIILLAVFAHAALSIRLRRGVSYTPGPAEQHAGAEALNEINQSADVAAWAAQSAVAAAVGRDYQSQLATTAQYVNQFTAPVTKQQAANAFTAVQRQQKATQVTGALAANSYAINHAASDAAEGNFAQAYIKFEGNSQGAAAHDAANQQNSYRPQQSYSQPDPYENGDKARQTATNVAALQAVQGVKSLDRAAAYAFTGGNGGGGGGGGGGYGGK